MVPLSVGESEMHNIVEKPFREILRLVMKEVMWMQSKLTGDSPRSISGNQKLLYTALESQVTQLRKDWLMERQLERSLPQLLSTPHKVQLTPSALIHPAQYPEACQRKTLLLHPNFNLINHPFPRTSMTALGNIEVFISISNELRQISQLQLTATNF
ncbi:hypothetical protein BDA96_10G198500 [Sorghum bicolor]|uniref:Uncharacterized protein n=2 Tax=Sorghum bicolor TaxID=4558 RepID=A0A921U1A0_SORBI|nr:hypothetical protein BDA96_10G198500 [Sorghum bicolor]KXG20072.1 hypothetical protein SORBI_3010G151100 [Sorghum bicolor]